MKEKKSRSWLPVRIPSTFGDEEVSIRNVINFLGLSQAKIKRMLADRWIRERIKSSLQAPLKLSKLPSDRLLRLIYGTPSIRYSFVSTKLKNKSAPQFYESLELKILQSYAPDILQRKFDQKNLVGNPEFWEIIDNSRQNLIENNFDDDRIGAVRHSALFH